MSEVYSGRAPLIRETLAAGDRIDGLAIYKRQATAEPLLLADEEVELGFLVRDGLHAAAQLTDASELSIAEAAGLAAVIDRGLAARERFIMANTRSVISTAQYFEDRGLELLDLIQEGTIGMIKAVDTWDPTRGIKFSTYSKWTIKAEIIKALHDQSRTIDLPHDVSQLLSSIHRHVSQIAQERGGIEPSDDEVADLFDISVEKLRQLQAWDRLPLSYDMMREREYQALHEEADDQTIIPLVPTAPQFRWQADELQADPTYEAAATAVDTAYDIDAVRYTIDFLTDREQRIISAHYGLGDPPVEPMTFKEIGIQEGVSSTRVHQVERKILRTLRHQPLAGLLGVAENLVPDGHIEELAESRRRQAAFRSAYRLPKQDEQGFFLWSC